MQQPPAACVCIARSNSLLVRLIVSATGRVLPRHHPHWAAKDSVLTVRSFGARASRFLAILPTRLVLPHSLLGPTSRTAQALSRNGMDPSLVRSVTQLLSL